MCDMIHQLEKYNQIDMEHIPIETICSTYSTNTVFHLFAKYPQVIESILKRVLEVSWDEVESNPLGNNSVSQSRWFRRVIQLLLKPNIHGFTPFNLALMSHNF